MHDSDHQNWRPRAAIQSWVLPRVDLVLVQTHAQARYLQEQYRLRHPPFYIGPRIDETFFSPIETANDYVLSLGNDSARDYDTLAAAVAPLDLPLRLLTRLAVNLPMDRRCRVERIERRVSYLELRDLYAGARFIVVPMRERISPGGMTSILEAMSMGKPVVMSASSGSVELVEPGTTGVVTPIGDAAALRAAISELWSDPDRCRTMGKAARERMDQHYSTRLRAQRMTDAVRLVNPSALQ